MLNLTLTFTVGTSLFNLSWFISRAAYASTAEIVWTQILQARDSHPSHCECSAALPESGIRFAAAMSSLVGEQRNICGLSGLLSFPAIWLALGTLQEAVLC